MAEENPVGFVGLGAMGSRMASRLLRSGYSVIGYNRTREKALPLLSEGLELAESPRVVAESAPIVLVMVLDGHALQVVSQGPDGIVAGLGHDDVVVVLSAVGPDAAVELAGEVAMRGARLIEAPVSGSLATVDAGTLSFMVSGDLDGLARARPVIDCLGSNVVPLGTSHGAAFSMKLAVNLSVGLQILGFAESLLLAEREGIDAETALKVLLSSVVSSPMLQYRGPFFLELPERAAGKLTLMQKDLDLALGLARRHSLPLPGAALTRELVSAAIAIGLGDEDMAAVGYALRRMSGS